MSEEDLDRLAGKLYDAYDGTEGEWENLKRDYPILVSMWRRVAEAAVRAIVKVLP